MGYKFTENGKTFVFLTDNELLYKHEGGLEYNDYVEFSRGADILIHDAEYTPAEIEKRKTWGHSDYRTALQLALDANVKEFGIFHLNQDRSDAEIDKFVDDCNKIIKEKGSDLKCYAVAQGMEFRL